MDKINYDKKMLEQIEGMEGRPRLLLHSCCGPCSTAVIERVLEHFDVTVFYYNPNIDDEEEYELRKYNQIKYIRKRYGEEGPVKFLEGEHDPGRFLEGTEGHEEDPEGGERCRLCFALRLSETAHNAKELGFDYFTTTLTVSPMKDPQTINPLGEAIGRAYGVEYLFSDFKKKGGYQRSIELSRKYGLYRQHFCGCRFSKPRDPENDEALTQP
jgi:hypothetical protein